MTNAPIRTRFFRSVILSVTTILSTPILAESSQGAFTLDFEGLKSSEQILNFYNGGTGSEGSKGPDKGISFSGQSLAIIDSDAGGEGNFANEPSPNTIAYFLEGDGLTMNVEKGFSEGFSFFYSSNQQTGVVQVFDGLNGTGKLIKELRLEGLGTAGKGDPTGKYDTWKLATVAFPGIAKSVSFKGVANRIGFDDITLDPSPPQTVFDFKMELKEITQKYGSSSSDGFTVWLNHISPIIPGESISNICKRYTFSVQESGTSQRGATLVGCAVQGKSSLQLDFDIIPIDNKRRFFEAGIIQVCRINTTDCESLDLVKDFTVYGTRFDLKRDAFRFENGSWNLAETKKGNARNDLAKIIDVVDDYLPEEKRRSLWSHAGQKNADEHWFEDETSNSKGLCYGMAVAAIAQFNHRLDQDQAWGVGGNLMSDWKQSIEDHWNRTTGEANPPYKPYEADNIHDQFDANSSEALKKIVYYFVGQPFFHDGKAGRETWVGNDVKWVQSEGETGYYRWSIEDADYRAKMIGVLKSGSPLQISMDEKNSFTLSEWGHTVVATQLIRYNGKDIWYIYNNSNPTGYQYFPIEDNSDYAITRSKNNLIFDHDGKKRPFVKVTSFESDAGEIDPHRIYARSAQMTRKAAAKAGRSATVHQADSHSYLFPHHIKVRLVGAEATDITVSHSNITVTPLPVISPRLDESKPYSRYDGFGQTLYLPRDQRYSIQIRRSAEGIPFKIFAVIPDELGEVTVMNFDDVSTSVAPGGYGEFFVGGQSADISLTIGKTTYQPTFTGTYALDVPSVGYPQAITAKNAVELVWDNPDIPNLSVIRIVRKEGERPNSPHDGEIVYNGLGEKFKDLGISIDRHYHYAIYAVSRDERYSAPVFLDVDTSRYTISGNAVLSGNGNPARDMAVELLTADKSKVLNISTTNKHGAYVFEGLTNGIYWLRFSADNQDTPKAERKVRVEDASLQVDDTSVTILPSIRINSNRELVLGTMTRISWNGQDLDDRRADLSLYRNGEWESLANGLDLRVGYFDWRVSGETDSNAKIRISLQADNNVYSEHTVSIIKGTKVLGANGSNGSNGGSGGGSLGVPLILLLLTAISFRNKDSQRYSST